MGKSKVYLNSKIILFIFAILIALACSKKLSAAETATFAISNVTIGQKEATVTKNTKDDSVYTAQVDERSIGDGYIKVERRMSMHRFLQRILKEKNFQ